MSHFLEGQIAGQTVHLSTLWMAWAGMGVTLAIAWALSRNLSMIPSGAQVVGEGIYGFVRGMTFPTSGEKGDKYLFVIGSLFLFILVANLMGQLPLRLIELPHGELLAATGDINTTLGLALVTLVTYVTLSIQELGLGGFIKHHFEPMPFMLPLHLLDHVTRPGSLMLRLYANVLVGETLSMVALKLVPLGLPLLVIFLETFVAGLQAYIFALLSTVYIGIMTSHGDDHAEHTHH